MKLLILKTNIKTAQKVRKIMPVFNSHPVIRKWSVDTEDIDNVLKVEASNHLNEKEIIQMVQALGFYCEHLPDY
jgi:hypothetical protein